MSADTPIEWTGRTWNPLVAYRKRDRKRGWFCTKCSPGCAHCYAESINKRLGTGHPYVRTSESEIEFGLVGLDAPQKWRKPQLVFVNSMTDLFHEAVPFDFIERVFAAMAMAPQHTFQVLTKRAKRMREFMDWLRAAAEAWERKMATEVTPTDVLNIRHMGRERTDNPFPNRTWPLPNVWLGTSTEDQERLEERLPELLKTPAAVRFLSAEPLLGKLDMLGIWNRILNKARVEQNLYSTVEPLSVGESAKMLGAALHWVIVGGESGPKARPCAIEHIGDLVQQCGRAETSCFVKQLGKVPTLGDHRLKLKHPKGGDIGEWAVDLRVREFPRRAA